MIIMCYTICYRDIICWGYGIGIIILGLIQFYIYYWMLIWLVIGILGLMVGNRILLDNTIIIGNVMDIYVLGLISILIIGWYFICIIGWSWLNYMWYYRVMGKELFLCLFIGIELSAHCFQSLTISNRICINIVAGCLFSYLISILVYYYYIGGYGIYMGMSGYEFINIGFQYGIFIFMVLSLILW